MSTLSHHPGGSPGPGFLRGGGTAGDLIRNHDWAASPLGPPRGWPQPLKTLVSVMLGSNQPMFVAWGPERTLLYNDPYAEILANKHPDALGRDFLAVWHEIRGDLVPIVAQAYAGEPVQMDDITLFMERRGFREETHFSFFYSPVRDDTDEVAGLFCACTEITAQVMAERRLRASEARFRGVQETSLDGFMVLDAVRDEADRLVDFRWTYANEAAEHIVGRPRDWFIGRCLLQEMPGNREEGLFDTYVHAVETGQPWTGEITYRRDGVDVFIRLMVAKVGDGIAVTFTDLSAHRHMEQRMREAAERVQLALDAGAIVGTWVWEVPSNRFTADERFARSFDLDPEACRSGLALEQVTTSIHEDDLARVEQAIAEALGRGGAYRCEYRVRQSDGIYRWIEANGRVELAPDGTPLRFPGVLLDIGQRRAAEAERDRATILLQTFAEAVPGVVYAKDRNGRMLIGNRGTTDLIGKPPEFYIGRTDAEFLDDRAQGEAVMANDRRIMDTGVAEQIEEEVRLPDGTPAIWLSTKAPMRDRSGAVIGLVGSSVDITARRRAEAALQELNRTLECRVAQAIAEREQAEEALRQSQKLESMGQLTGGVAHDFNNLLTPIVGGLDMLQRRQVGDARARRLIDGALQSAERAKTLVQRLLAFARRQPLQPVPVGLRPLVEGIADLAASTLGPRVRITVDIASGLPAVQADPNQLEMAILNLAVNARDAMPEGGELTIKGCLGTVLLGHRSKLAPGEYVLLAISDTGIGMDEATQARAVEPFFSTKGIGKGTGLGLSMVHGLAAQLGGALTIRSAPGAGTTIELWLPLAYADAQAQGKAQDVVDPRSGIALLVDDEDLVRASTAEMLSEFGYGVVEVTSAEEALRCLSEGLAPDIIITDHLMPGMSGTDLARLLREQRPDLPVLIVSGYAEDEGIPADLPRLTKPFRQAELSMSLAELTRA